MDGSEYENATTFVHMTGHPSVQFSVLFDYSSFCIDFHQAPNGVANYPIIFWFDRVIVRYQYFLFCSSLSLSPCIS